MTGWTKRIRRTAWKWMVVLALLTPTSQFAADGRAVAAAASNGVESTAAPMSDAIEYELDRTGWVTTAYKASLQGNVPANAIDGNQGTRWANEEAQFPTGNQWFQIDMGQSKAFSKLTMNSGSDYPRGYNVQVSSNGSDWQTVFAGAGSSSLMTAGFEQQNARYIRIVQTGTAGTSWWSINEINVYDSVSGGEAEVTGITLEPSETTLLERENLAVTAVVAPDHAVNKKVIWTTSSPEVAVVDDAGRVVAVGEGEATITATTEDGGFADSVLIDVSARTDIPSAAIGKKKGIASSKYLPLDPASTNDADKRAIHPERLESLDVSWAYNWSTDFNFSGATETDFEFVPMIWGPGAITDGKINELKQGKLDGKYTHLLGFNEPELAEQSSTSVEDAIRLWPRLMETGLRLGSPSVAYPGDGSLDAYGIYWLREFMQEAEERHYPVDFITLHFYQDFTHPDAVEQLKETLIELYDEYQKPIWITEIGTIVFGTPRYEPTELMANEYLREVMPMLESLPFIERYSWFVDSCAHEAACRYTNLYDLDDRLTRMGEIYTVTDGTTVIPVSGVTLEPYSGTLQVGASIRLTHQIQPAGAANYGVAWTSSNEDAATVDPTGIVTGIAEGTSTITVTTEDGGFVAAIEIEVAPSTPVSYQEIADVTGKLFYGDFMWGDWYFLWNEDKARELSGGKTKAAGTDSALSTGQVYTHGDVVMIGFDQEVTFDKIVLKSPASGQIPYRIKAEYSANPLPQPMNIPASPILLEERTGYSTAGDTLTFEWDEPITARSIWFQALTDGANSEPGTTAWSVSEVRLFQEITENEPGAPSRVTDLAIDEANDVITLSWAASDHASSYNIYRATGKYSNYEYLGESETASYTDEVPGEKYKYYYKVAAVNSQNNESELTADVSLEGELFGDTMDIFSQTDDRAIIDGMTADAAAKMIPMSAAEFSTDRYAFLFKPGQYALNRIDVGYYTTVYGLGATPLDTMLPRIEASSWGANSLTNFWRGVENIGIDAGAPQNEVKWAVSQAAPARRLYVNGKLHLDDIGKEASGGFLADSWITGQTGSWSQQQYFLRNNRLDGGWYDGVWNMLFVGVDNAPAETANWDKVSYQSYTVEADAPRIREKPFLYLNAGSGDYEVFVPGLRADAKGISWSQGNPGAGTSRSIDDFYVAKAAVDTADTINDALEQGKHLLLTPGIYEVDQPIKVNNENTVVLGIGLATIVPTNGNDAMQIADVGGVTVAGILFDAGVNGSEHLLQVGPDEASIDHSDNPTLLSDIFTRVGGAVDGKADITVEINSSHVIGDHFWLWRADHGVAPGSTGWTKNVGKHGIVVNGDDVTIYGLFVEHFQHYQTLWNGENGQVFFYQSEIPYDPPYQSDYMSHDGTVKGYSSYKVADHVKSHYAAALGIYDVFVHTQEWVELENAIEVPNGTMIKHAAIVSLGANGGTNHVVNGVGQGVHSGQAQKSGIKSYYVEREPETEDSSTLSGPSQVYGQQPFDLTIGMSSVQSDFTMMNVVLSYDPAKLAFDTITNEDGSLSLADSAISSSRQGLQVLGTAVKADKGQIQIIMGSGGSDAAIGDPGQLLALRTRSIALDVTGETTVALSNFRVSYEGSSRAVQDASHTIRISNEQVDKTALQAAITAAQTKHGASAEGYNIGEYPIGSKAALKSVIDRAITVLQDAGASPAAVEEALNELNAALSAFNQSVNGNPGVIDKSALTAAIATAQSKHDAAIAGDRIGQYPAADKSALHSAILEAKSILGSTGATQTQVNAATAALNAAIQTLSKKLITLVPGQTSITIDDLSIIAKYYGAVSSDDNWSEIEKADLYHNGKIDLQVLAAVARMILDNWLLED